MIDGLCDVKDKVECNSLLYIKFIDFMSTEWSAARYIPVDVVLNVVYLEVEPKQPFMHRPCFWRGARPAQNLGSSSSKSTYLFDLIIKIPIPSW